MYFGSKCTRLDTQVRADIHKTKKLVLFTFLKVGKWNCWKTDGPERAILALYLLFTLCACKERTERNEVRKKIFCWHGKYFKSSLFIEFFRNYSGLEQFSTHNSHKQWHSTFIFRDGTNYTAGCQKPLDNKWIERFKTLCCYNNRHLLAHLHRNTCSWTAITSGVWAEGMTSE